MGNPRRSNGARRDAARRWLRSQGTPCWICGLPIDYALPARHPLSFECDELLPVSKGGSPYARDNLASAHRVCNGWRSAKDSARVDEIRSAALSRYGPWQDPNEFVALAKAIEHGKHPGRDAGVSVLAKPVQTTTNW